VQTVAARFTTPNDTSGDPRIATRMTAARMTAAARCAAERRALRRPDEPRS